MTPSDTSGIPADVRHVVAAAYPELSGRPLNPLAEGQFSLAVLLDETLVLRFPHHRFGGSKLRREAELLSAIAQGLPAPVSVPVRVELDRDSPGAFVAHHFIPGRIVRRQMLEHLDPPAAQQLASAAGGFLAALHRIDPSAVPAAVPRQDFRAFAADLRARTMEVLWPRMNGAGRRRAGIELAGLDSVVDRPPVLCHCDIGGNLIYDETLSQMGVIDFGEAMLTNPVLDAASLSVLGPGFMQAVARTYPLLADCLADADRLRATFALQDALGGAAQEDWGYVDRILDAYQRTAGTASTC